MMNTMTVRNEAPPEWIMSGCMNAFRVDVNHTVWTYGDTIYNPGGRPIPPDVVAHEAVHAKQQREYVEDVGVNEWGMTCEEHYGEPFEHKLEDGTECAGPGMAPLKGKDAWWRRYLSDPEFRVEQEAQAYGMQYAFICSKQTNRDMRARALHTLAGSFSGPLYQCPISNADAKKMIRECSPTL